MMDNIRRIREAAGGRWFTLGYIRDRLYLSVAELRLAMREAERLGLVEKEFLQSISERKMWRFK